MGVVTGNDIVTSPSWNSRSTCFVIYSVNTLTPLHNIMLTMKYLGPRVEELLYDYCISLSTSRLSQHIKSAYVIYSCFSYI